MMRFTLMWITLLLLAGNCLSQIKADSFPFAPDDDVLARLDNFRIEMLRYPGSAGHIVIYKPRHQPIGEFLRYFYGVERMWIMRGYPGSQLVLHPGAEKEHIEHVLWIVRTGDELSTNEFDINAKLTERVTMKRLVDVQCIGCAPSVPLKQWIFREGLNYFGKALQSNKDSRAEIQIGINEFVSGTKSERNQLRNDIYKVLSSEYEISRDRIRISFNKSMFAKFYLIPRRSTRR